MNDTNTNATLPQEDDTLAAIHALVRELATEPIETEEVIPEMPISEAQDPPIEGVFTRIEDDPETTPPEPELQAAQADAAVTRLNERFAWISSTMEIFRLTHNDFVSQGKFHAEYSNEVVEALVGGSLKKIKASEAWLKSRNRRTHEAIVYAPGAPRITENKVNLWAGWGATPVEGDISPWNAFLDFIFGEERIHRDWFEQWVAYPIKHPGTKLNTAVVLWSSQQGIGKTLIGQTVGRIYGPKNYKEITSRELKGRFNGWTKSCQFVLGEENSGFNRLSDADRLKHLITGETIQVEEKFQPLLEIKNQINFLFTSNHPNAFYLEAADRRYFVWEIQGSPKPMKFYENFVRWRDEQGGVAALMHHLQNLDTSGFDPKGNAPMTLAKAAMIDMGRSDLERWLARFRDDPKYASLILGREVLTLEELSEFYYLRMKRRARPLEIGQAMKRLGDCTKRRVQIGGDNRQLYHPVTRVDYWRDAGNDVWAAEVQKKRA